MFNFGAIGQGVAGTIQSAVGLFQKKRARGIRRKGEKLMEEAWKKRTNYEIPQEVRDNLASAQNEAYSKPAVMQYMEDAAGRQLAGNMSAVRRYATSSADALAAAAGANQGYGDALTNAAVAGAQTRQQNMQNVYNAGNTLADYKSMAWDMNVNQPFLQRMQWAQQMIGSGYQGENDAINTFVEGQNQIGQSAANFFSLGGGAGGGGGGSFNSAASQSATGYGSSMTVNARPNYGPFNTMSSGLA